MNKLGKVLLYFSIVFSGILGLMLLYVQYFSVHPATKMALGVIFWPSLLIIPFTFVFGLVFFFVGKYDESK